MRKYLKSVEWILGATAAVFFVFGRFVAPYYEELFSYAAPDEEQVAISTYCLWASGILAGVVVIRLIWRLKSR